MKTIGIIGGLGPPSTVKYYEGLTSGMQERTGGQAHGAQVIINSVNGADIASFRAVGDDNERYADITQRLIESHEAEGVILGCTELTLLDMPSRINVPLFDTVQIHVNAALDFVLS